MERFTIGRCRTGKILTSHPDLDGLTTYEEMFDAMAMLTTLAARELRRDEQSDISEHLSREADGLADILNEARQWDSQMKSIGATTAFDIRRHAIRLLRPEFKE